MNKQPKNAPAAHRNLERPTTTQSTCHLPYPPGSTLLQCRLEDDAPVAYVAQVPAEGDVANQNVCLFVETKQSPSGPYSRVVSRPMECSKDSKEFSLRPNDLSNSTRALPAYSLESRECDEGPMATITKLPMTEGSAGCANVIITMQTAKSAGQADGPSSRIIYGPEIGETLKAAGCTETAPEAPVIMIECNARPKETSARIVRCRDRSYHESSSVPRDATKFYQHGDIMETVVGEGGPKAYALHVSDKNQRLCTDNEAKQIGIGSTTKTYPREPKGTSLECKAKTLAANAKTACSPVRCLKICPGANKPFPSAQSRRNGLDPEDNEPISLFQRVPRKQTCPCAFDPPAVVPKTVPVSPQADRPVKRVSSDVKAFKCILMPRELAEQLIAQGNADKPTEDCKFKDLTKLKFPRTEEYGFEVRKQGEVCGKPKTVPKVDACRCKAQNEIGRSPVEKEPEDDLIEISSQELITQFREYFPPYQLQRYEICRAKRNGMQDQCQLSIPGALLNLQRKERLRRANTKEKSDQTNAIRPMIMKGPEGSKKQAKSKQPKVETKTKKRRKVRRNEIPPKLVKSRELYAGFVYVDCDCYHRNGLQHDCRRVSCGGRSCRVSPWPECELGTYFKNKWDKYYDHLDRVPPISFCGPTRAWLEFLEQQEKKLKGQPQEQKVQPKMETKCVKKIDESENTPVSSEQFTDLAKDYLIIPIIETSE